MKKIKAEKLSNMAMVAGGEKRVQIVVHGNDVKEWVGFGWIILRKATAEDRRKYPKVIG